LSNLYKGSRSRYESKIEVTGLAVDPYTIDEAEWTPDTENNPQLWWSDLMFYMVSTPSQYTTEAINSCMKVATV